jgi:hypothetical protein
MIDKEKVGKLVIEINDRVKLLRQLVKDGATEGDFESVAFARDVVMLGRSTTLLAEKCKVPIT